LELLPFSEQIKDIVAKAHQLANFIHHCFVSRNANLLVRVCRTNPLATAEQGRPSLVLE